MSVSVDQPFCFSVASEHPDSFLFQAGTTGLSVFDSHFPFSRRVTLLSPIWSVVQLAWTGENRMSYKKGRRKTGFSKERRQEWGGKNLHL